MTWYHNVIDLDIFCQSDQNSVFELDIVNMINIICMKWWIQATGVLCNPLTASMIKGSFLQQQSVLLCCTELNVGEKEMRD